MILIAAESSPVTPYQIWRKTRIPRLEKVLKYIQVCEALGYLEKVNEEPYHKNGEQMRREYRITSNGRLFLMSLPKLRC